MIFHSYVSLPEGTPISGNKPLTVVENHGPMEKPPRKERKLWVFHGSSGETGLASCYVGIPQVLSPSSRARWWSWLHWNPMGFEGFSNDFPMISNDSPLLGTVNSCKCHTPLSYDLCGPHNWKCRYNWQHVKTVDWEDLSRCLVLVQKLFVLLQYIGPFRSLWVFWPKGMVKWIDK